MALLPIPGSALEAQYTGPYFIERKVSAEDYLISTHERKKKSNLCHINMLNPYCDRGVGNNADVNTHCGSLCRGVSDCGTGVRGCLYGA